MTKLLFVCMGNICRSPTAHGVMRAKLAAAGLGDRVLVDSAGTHAYHVGEPPDERSQEHAARRGYDLSDLRARALTPQDFEQFERVLVMDEANQARALAICPPHLQHRVSKLLGSADVPDPYYGGAQGFETVLDLVETACDRLLTELQGLRH
ncbi:protein-tyrosine phosphatase [Inhella inkyongensis]|uniref:protein-tyrosine-phosphatase n=1 Tax=Inhella inkyongensis TaxID=392593 RepID=A0A840S2Y9_9BURK|nr:low molecular weight protein-tyrosine-phosphatase [Inhella inkyongensis]MBB5205577.1 protein-tyrosine phosphatase [Inhella inkyongensis]